MPVIKSAIKKMRQDVKRTERNNVVRNRLKSKMKELTKAAHDNKVAELPELLKGAYSIIDTAFKKNLIKRNNAARKKSNMAKAVATAMNKGKSTEASA